MLLLRELKQLCHSAAEKPGGATFFDALLKSLDPSYVCPDTDLRRIPAIGPVVVPSVVCPDVAPAFRFSCRPPVLIWPGVASIYWLEGAIEARLHFAWSPALMDTGESAWSDVASFDWRGHIVSSLTIVVSGGVPSCALKAIPPVARL
jgi:hypothetical protein